MNSKITLRVCDETNASLWRGADQSGEHGVVPVWMERVVSDVEGLELGVGDLAAFWADSSKAFEKMSWKTERNIKNIHEDTWRWHKLNPTGYGVG